VLLAAVAMATVSLAGVTSVVTPVVADAASNVAMYRLYNGLTGEHFYTGNLTEATTVVKSGWVSEGIGWWAPPSGTPVYRLSAKAGTGSAGHLYTTNETERKTALASGQWNDEGIGWYSAGSIPIYRQFNPTSGQHNYTTDANEKVVLTTQQGWRDEGVGWYGVATGDPFDQTVNMAVGPPGVVYQDTRWPWSGSSTTVLTYASFSLGPTWQGPVLQGLANWNNSGAHISYVTGASTHTFTLDLTDTGKYGLTSWTYSGYTITWFRTQLNQTLILRDGAPVSNLITGVTAHELGHPIGLKDNPGSAATSSIMNYGFNWNVNTTPTRWDVSRVNAHY